MRAFITCAVFAVSPASVVSLLLVVSRDGRNGFNQFHVVVLVYDMIRFVCVPGGTGGCDLLCVPGQILLVLWCGAF